MGKPATLGLPAAKTRFDELQAVHALQAYATHFVVSAIAFHHLCLTLMLTTNYREHFFRSIAH